MIINLLINHSIQTEYIWLFVTYDYDYDDDDDIQYYSPVLSLPSILLPMLISTYGSDVVKSAIGKFSARMIVHFKIYGEHNIDVSLFLFDDIIYLYDKWIIMMIIFLLYTIITSRYIW